jgi:hypothetical protein
MEGTRSPNREGAIFEHKPSPALGYNFNPSLLYIANSSHPLSLFSFQTVSVLGPKTTIMRDKAENEYPYIAQLLGNQSRHQK